MADLGFNTDDVAPDSGGGAFPPGEYDLHVTEEEVKTAKSGKGMVLALTMEVLSPEQAGRKLFMNINFRHENPVAQKIGQGQVSALAKAIGEPISDSSAIPWKPFRAEVGIEQYTKGNGDPGERNIIKRFLYEGAEPSAPSTPASKAEPTRQAPPARQAAPAPRPAQGANVPWKRSA